MCFTNFKNLFFVGFFLTLFSCKFGLLDQSPAPSLSGLDEPKGCTTEKEVADKKQVEVDLKNATSQITANKVAAEGAVKAHAKQLIEDAIKTYFYKRDVVEMIAVRYILTEDKEGFRTDLDVRISGMRASDFCRGIKSTNPNCVATFSGFIETYLSELKPKLDGAQKAEAENATAIVTASAAAKQCSEEYAKSKNKAEDATPNKCGLTKTYSIPDPSQAGASREIPPHQMEEGPDGVCRDYKCEPDYFTSNSQGCVLMTDDMKKQLAAEKVVCPDDSFRTTLNTCKKKSAYGDYDKDGITDVEDQCIVDAADTAKQDPKNLHHSGAYMGCFAGQTRDRDKKK